MPDALDWTFEGGNHANRASKCGRWKILHPRNALSGRWELYGPDAWSGDWPTLRAAKAEAARLMNEIPWRS